MCVNVGTVNAICQKKQSLFFVSNVQRKELAKCFNPTCKCKDLKIVREVILRCTNCHCAVKVEITKLDFLEHCGDNPYTNKLYSEEEQLFTVLKNAK